MHVKTDLIMSSFSSKIRIKWHDINYIILNYHNAMELYQLKLSNFSKIYVNQFVDNSSF